MYVAQLFDHKLSPTRPGMQAYPCDRTIVTHEQEPWCQSSSLKISKLGRVGICRKNCVVETKNNLYSL
jgi:hypothetical protein